MTTNLNQHRILTQVDATLWNVCTLPLVRNHTNLLRCAQHYGICALVSLTNKPHALLGCMKNHNLVPMAHGPICTFTFTLVANDSPNYMYNYN
jgi:hypothetical protein